MAANVHAVYFSPTGSSRAMAQEVASVLAQDMSLTHAEDWDWTFPEARAAEYNVGAGDVLVFAFPVYAGRIPQLLLEPLERLNGQGAYVVPLAVYGNRHYDDALLEAPAPVPADMPLSELISLVALAPCAVPVVCEENNYIGIISKAMLLQALDKEGPTNE